jgi:hypothetical protein
VLDHDMLPYLLVTSTSFRMLALVDVS